jgi:hypothetical protein
MHAIGCGKAPEVLSALLLVQTVKARVEDEDGGTMIRVELRQRHGAFEEEHLLFAGRQKTKRDEAAITRRHFEVVVGGPSDAAHLAHEGYLQPKQCARNGARAHPADAQLVSVRRFLSEFYDDER